MISAPKPLALTLGDPAGIGPEITVKAWQALRRDPSACFALIAPLTVAQAACHDAGMSAPVSVSHIGEASTHFCERLPVLAIEGERAIAGQPDSRHAPAITGSIEKAVSLCLDGQADAVVTNPIAKDVLYEAGFKHPGHTEYLGALTQDTPYAHARGPVMMLSGGGLRVALATVHMALKQAAKTLTPAQIEQVARVMHDSLRLDFGIDAPRIAMAGLNPHAGEGGALGTEERDMQNPLAEKLRSEGINLSNARPADTLFHAEARETYDAVLAMYHDQGLIPVKTLDFHGGVNITLGLPIVRTSPDHGTAFDIAGKGLARADSLIAATKTARQIANHRRNSTHG